MILVRFLFVISDVGILYVYDASHTHGTLIVFGSWPNRNNQAHPSLMRVATAPGGGVRAHPTRGTSIVIE